MIIVLIFLAQLFCVSRASQSSQLVLLKGFSAAPSSAVDTFQPILADQTGNFSLGFLRVNRTGLDLAVIHVSSSQPVWTPGFIDHPPWTDHTKLYFNGSLVVSDSSSRVYWSTDATGDRVALLNTSNVQIHRFTGGTDGSYDVVWQSFDFPTDTLVEGQNFTSNMSLTSSDGLYSLRLGSDFAGLYARFGGDPSRMYWKHRALEAKAAIIEGAGPIYARVEPDGYMAMYQNGTTPVDVEPFSTFHRSISAFHLLRLEPDGNLKGYYWTGSSWAVDYQAITDFCELPSPCGSYGLCKPGGGSCSCLDNRTEYRSGPCRAPGSGDLCRGDRFTVLRRKGVELPHKQLMSYQTVSSLEECESICEANCSCWGAVYNNGSGSGFCYPLDYPVQTLLSVGDETKVGYFKMGAPGRSRGRSFGIGVLIWVLIGAAVVGAVGFVGYRVWRRRGGVKGYLGEEYGASPGPYKDLGSASFRSIELMGSR